LVREEVKLLGGLANASLSAGVYGPEADELDLVANQWHEHKVVLAHALNDDEWRIVGEFYLAVDRVLIGLKMNTPPRPTAGDALLSSDRAIYEDMRKAAVDGWKTLDDYLVRAARRS